MALSRALPLVLALAALPLWPAAAQFGGTLPGTPQAPPPPQCQQLLSFRDETQKHGQALQAAGQKKAPPEEVCKLFKAFLAAETKLAEGLEENAATCGVPPEVIKQVKASRAKAAQTGKRVCDMAAQRPASLHLDWPDPLRFDAPAPHCSEKTLQPGVPCVE